VLGTGSAGADFRPLSDRRKITDTLFNKMLAAKNFQAGMIMIRQLEFSLFDFRIHQDYDSEKGGRIYEILEQVRAQVAVVQPPKFNRFAHGFSHIFAGGLCGRLLQL